jgi:uncharacterized protein (TIRG00374 family)
VVRRAVRFWRRPAFVFLLKLFGLVVISFIVAWQIDLKALETTLMSVDLRLLGTACALLVIQIAVASRRWILLLRMHGLHPNGTKYFAYFGMGSITNLSLPGGVAGDAFRIWQATRDGLNLQSAVNSVLLDRIVSLSILAVLVVVCVLWQAVSGTLMMQPIKLAAFGIGSSVMLAVALLALFEPMLKRFARTSWLSFVHLMSRSTRDLLTRVSIETFHLVAVTFAGHLLLVASVICLARAFAIPIGVADALVVFPMVLLVSSIPITPGGWGLREGAMTIALAGFGGSVEASVSTSVTYGILAMVACLPAAITFMVIRERRENPT